MNYLIGLSGLAAGLAAGYWLRRQIAINKAIGAENKAEKIIDEAKTKEKEILLKAQDKALKLIDEAKQENESHRKEITGWQARLEKRETAFSQKIMELQDKQQQLYDKITQVEETKEKIRNKLLGVKLPEERRKKLLGNTNASGKRSEESKEKMRKPKSSEHIEKIKQSKINKKLLGR